MNSGCLECSECSEVSEVSENSEVSCSKLTYPLQYS